MEKEKARKLSTEKNLPSLGISDGTCINILVGCSNEFVMV
jgi:hypothetical protein